MQKWADPHGLLLGRARGENARASLEREIRAIGPTDAIGVDFRGVRALTVSFAEGFFVPLLGHWLTGYYDEHPVVVFGANDEVVDTLEAVLRLRNMAVLVVRGEEAALVGGETGLRETARLAYALGEFSAADIANQLGTSLQAANNRLKELVRRGVLARTAGAAETGGRQYTYRAARVPRSRSRSARSRRGRP